MNSVHGRNTMMSMLDAQPEEQQNRNAEYWNDESDHLSPIRKHLISTYLQIPDEEAMPLLGEYFGVALSFVALGALVRGSNSSKRKQKKLTDEERFDLRSFSRFQRMALESMLRESMERLRNLSQNAYQLEERVKHLVAENFAQDKERFQLIERLVDADKSVQELMALRKAEGKANEKVMGIVASKEQDWIKEKRSLQKEVEKLKETVKGMTREAKYQARRCRDRTCDHYNGTNKVIKNLPLPKARMSLRDLHSLRDTEPPKYDVPKMDRKLAEVDRNQEDEDDSFLLKTISMKNFSEKLGEHKVEKSGEWSEQGSIERSESGEGNISGSSLSPTKEGMKEQQDMENELASILKRVGMLKQRSFSTGGLSVRTEESAAGEKAQLLIEVKGNADKLKDEGILISPPEKKQPEERSPVPDRSSFEAAEYASEHDYNSLESTEVGTEDHEASSLELPEIGPSPPTAYGDSLAESDDGVGKDEMPIDTEGLGSISACTGEELPESSKNLQRLPSDGIDHVQSADIPAGINVVPSMSLKGLSSSEESVSPSSRGSDAELVDEKNLESKEAGVTIVSGLMANSKPVDVEGDPGGERESSSQMDGEDQKLQESANDDSAAVLDHQAGSQSGAQSDIITQSPDSSTDTVAAGLDAKSEDQKQHSSDAKAQSNLEAEKFAPNSDGSLDNQEDIPVFERRNSDDSSGGLPEPEEKRVCGPGVPDQAMKGIAADGQQIDPVSKEHLTDKATKVDDERRKEDFKSGDEKLRSDDVRQPKDEDLTSKVEA